MKFINNIAYLTHNFRKVSAQNNVCSVGASARERSHREYNDIIKCLHLAHGCLSHNDSRLPQGTALVIQRPQVVLLGGMISECWQPILSKI